MLNDYFDYRKGVDRPGTYGSSGLLINGTVSPRFILISGILCYLLVIPIAVYLWIRVGFWVLGIGIAGLIMGVLYTFGIGLKYRALGDIAVFAAFGVLVTLGAYYVQTGELSWIPVFYSIPLGLLIDGILHGNNLRDISTDAEVQVRTLAGRLGIKGSQYFYLFLVAGSFLSIPILAVTCRLPWPAMVTFVSLPLAIRNLKAVFQYPEVPVERFRMIDAMGAQLQLAFGLLMIAGVISGHWI